MILTIIIIIMMMIIIIIMITLLSLLLLLLLLLLISDAGGPYVRRWPNGTALVPRGADVASERDKWVSTNGVMLFDRWTFWVLPLTYFIFPKVPGCTFFPLC